MARELNVVALVKGQEQYVYIYDDANQARLIDALRDHAADPRLSFSWFDAAVLTEKVRQQAASEKTPGESRSRLV